MPQPGPSQPAGGPVGDGNYEVQAGDCIESVAYEHGFFWETVWNHPKNSDLQKSRKDPNILLAGDKVFVPEREEKQENGATEARHKFKRKGVPSKIYLVLKERNEPRANLPYILEIDGWSVKGVTNQQGELKHSIPPNAREGRLRLGPSGTEIYTLQLGGVDPIVEISGVQSRLKHLGYQIGEIDGKLGPETERAIRAFQTKHGIPVTGSMDESTRQKLVSEHGS